MKQFGQHILLKCISLASVTPFYAASLVETVQSDIASEKPGVFDVFKEGASRLLCINSPTRLLPIWSLVLPGVSVGLSKYLFG
jgi:solute carrier family 25 protein 46